MYNEDMPKKARTQNRPLPARRRSRAASAGRLIVQESRDRLNLTYAARIISVLPFSRAAYRFMEFFVTQAEKTAIVRIAGGRKVRFKKSEKLDIIDIGYDYEESPSREDLAPACSAVVGRPARHAKVVGFF